MKKKYKRLLVDSVAFMASSFASKILVFLLIPLYTAILSTDEYGIADLITNTVNVLYPILTMCIMEATLRYACEKEIDKEKVLANSIFIIGMAEIALIVFELLISIFYKSMNIYWLWFSIIFLCFNFHEVIAQYTKGIGKTKIFALSGVVHTFVIITCNLIGLLCLKQGLNAYLSSIIIGYIITSLFLIVFAKIRIRIRIDKYLLKDMLKYSIPLIPTVIAWWINVSADKYIIIYYHGIALSGIYSIAYKIPSILTLFTNVFSSAWTISVIKNVNDNDNDSYQSSVYKYFNLFNVLICSLLIVISKFIGSILFAKDFFIAWKCVPLLLVAYLFSGLSGFLASSFRAAKKTKYLLVSSIIGSVTNIVLNLLVIKKFGIIGASFTTAIGFAIIYYIRIKLIKKAVDLDINIKKDSLIYFLLILQALIITFEVKYSFLYGIAIFASISIFYFKDLNFLMKILMKKIKKRKD